MDSKSTTTQELKVEINKDVLLKLIEELKIAKLYIKYLEEKNDIAKRN